MNEKIYDYTNDIGARKQIRIEQKDDVFICVILNLENGEVCGETTVTQEQMDEFLKHYGISEEEE